MSKNNSYDAFEAQDTELDDPFANLGKSRYYKKSILRDRNIPFNIMGVTGPSTGQFGEEIILDIHHADYETGEMIDSRLSFPVLNQKKEVSARAKALLQVQKGLGMGKTYDGYYLTGSGSGYLLTKEVPKQA